MKRLTFLWVAILTCFVAIPPFFSQMAVAEPSCPEIFHHLQFENLTEIDVETFPQGKYNVTLYAEFAEYHSRNVLGYYEVGNNISTFIFNGSDGERGYLSFPLTTTIVTNHAFGLSIFTPDGIWYFTETHRNTDGQRHAKVYQPNDASAKFIICFEDLYDAGDRDYQDLIISLELEIPKHVIPEIPFGTILGICTMVIAFLSFVRYRRLKKEQLFRN